MDPIALGLAVLVVASCGVATAALLYAVSLRARLAETRAAVEALETDSAIRAATEDAPYELFQLEWEKLRSRWHRHGESFALALVDIGDALRPDATLPSIVTAKALAVIAQEQRIEDCVFQLDGRTVAVLLAGSSAEGGWLFVDRLRRVLGNDPVTHERGAAYLDVRVGVAEWSMQMTDLEGLLKAAYHARKDFSGQIAEQRGDFLPGARGAVAS